MTTSIEIWEQYANLGVTFREVECSLSAEGDGKVLLIPRDGEYYPGWPVDVLTLPAEDQEWLLEDLRQSQWEV